VARIGFVTDEHHKTLTASDRLVAEALVRMGHEVVPLVWTDGSENASGLDAAVYRSAWDTWSSPETGERFLSFVRRLPGVVPRTWNPLELLLWGLDKRYMLDLARAGVAVPRTSSSGRRLRLHKRSPCSMRPRGREAGDGWERRRR
jgi:hypothetical protein